MNIKNEFTFPEQYRKNAEEYISYKRSLGFRFSYDDQRKCNRLLNYLYENSKSHDVTKLTKELTESYLSQFSHARPRTIHTNQSFIRQYGLFLKQRGHNVYVYPSTLIQCSKDFMPHIFSKNEIYRILEMWPSYRRDS